MKKLITIVLLGVLLALTGALAQNHSLERGQTFGLFSNEIDAALFLSLQNGSGPTFTDLKKNYVFGSVENSQQVTNDGYSSSALFGYYQAGSDPWSMYVAPSFTGAPTIQNVTYASTAAAPKVVGTTTYNYNNADSTITYGPVPWKTLTLSAQYLLSLKSLGLVTGLDFSFYTTDSRTLGTATNLSFKQVDKTYGDTAIATDAPVIVERSATTTDQLAIYGETNMAFSIPALLKIANLPVYANLTLTGKGFENSSSVKKASTYGTTFTGAGIQNADTLSAISYLGLDFAFNAKVALGTLIPGNAKNTFIVGGGFAVEPGIASGSSSTMTQNTTITAGVVANNARAESKASYVVDKTIPFSLSANAAQTIYMEIDPAITLSFMPSAAFSFALQPGNAFKVKEATVVTNVDANANGLFTDAGDSTQTVTTTFQNAMFNYTTRAIATGYSDGNSISSSITLPVSVKIKPKDWFVSFALSTNTTLGLNWLNATNYSAGASSSTSTTVVGGATTTSTTTAAPIAVSTTGSVSYITGFSHTLLLTMPLPADSHIDISLNGSNLLDFESIVVQAIIPLK